MCTEPPLGVVDAECARVADDVGRLLEELGHDVEAARPRWELMLALAAGPMQVPGPAALVTAEEIASLEPRNQALATTLAALTVVDHSRWVNAVRTASVQFLKLWDRIDVLVTPTVGVVPPRADWARWDDDPETHMRRFASFPNFAQPFNLSGQPAVPLPLAITASGLPLGVQLVGRPLAEATLIQVAAQLERQSPWLDRTAAVGAALVGRSPSTL